MDPAPLQRMFQAARAEGITALAAFLGLCAVYAGKARRALQAGLDGPGVAGARPERNISPAAAAGRLGISVRKLTRERFTTYRDICVPIDGQTRGYVVSERALDAHLARQRDGR